jgi:hypothetical protein
LFEGTAAMTDDQKKPVCDWCCYPAPALNLVTMRQTRQYERDAMQLCDLCNSPPTRTIIEHQATADLTSIKVSWVVNYAANLVLDEIRKMPTPEEAINRWWNSPVEPRSTICIWPDALKTHVVDTTKEP